MVVEERELFNSQPNLLVIGPEVNAKFGKAYPEDILVMNQKQLGINNSDHTLNYGAGDVNAQINIDGLVCTAVMALFVHKITISFYYCRNRGLHNYIKAIFGLSIHPCTK